MRSPRAFARYRPDCIASVAGADEEETGTGGEVAVTVSHCEHGAVVPTTSSSTSTSTSTSTSAPTTTTTLVSPTTVTNVTTTTTLVPDTTPSPTAEAATATAGLPRTGGGPSLPLLVAGLVTIAGGGGLLFASRRMTEDAPHS